MALQVKRKNIGQAPTRSNPYLNKTNLPYQKGIIMEEGGELQPGQLSQSDIEKKLALEEVLRQQKLRNNQTNISQYKPKKGDNERMLANKEKYREEQSKPLNKAARSQVAANAMNNIVEPMLEIEMAMGAGKLLKPIAKAAGKYLTEQTALKNAYKLNPYAFKPNEANWYRQVGKSAIDDAFNTEVVRVPREEVSSRMLKEFEEQLVRMQGSGLEAMLSRRTPASPYFMKGELFYPMGRKPTITKSGKISNNPAGKGSADYLIETGLPNESFQPSYVKGMRLGVPNQLGETAILKPNPTLRELENFKFYKQHWLKGYKEIPKPQHSEEIVQGNISWFNNPTFRKNNPQITSPEQYLYNSDKFGRPTSANTDHLTPFDMRTLTKEQYKKFMSNERLTKRTYNNPFENFPKKAIGGMFNPFKEKIVPQETSTESDDYSYEDDMDDIEDDYESQLSEKDIEMDNIMKEKLALERKSRMDNKMIKELSLAKYDMQQEQLAQSLVAMEDEGDFSNENIYSSQSGTGRYGQQIMSELSSSLGYKPVANSIFRTPEKQEELIKQGFGVKNSFHLTGDAVDLKPEDWNKIPDMVKSKMKGKYDIISHNNHVHIEPKTRFKVGGVYEGIDYKGLEELKKLGYKFEIL